MYFNRKNSEQKNWRMIKKGKHFLFGCSLVFAVGAALVAPSVKVDAVEAKQEHSSTAEVIKLVAAEENATYAAPAVEVAPAAVVEEKVETTHNSKEELVVTTEKAKEADSIQAPEVTVVYNPAALTDEEKAKVVAAVKAANSKATDVQVQADGSVVVTFADGSTASLSAAQTIKDGSKVAKPRRARAAVAAPVITSNLDGKGSSATDVTVQAPAGSTVKLYNSDSTVIGQAVADAQGVATVTPTNSLPVGEITATATPAGESESPKSAPVTATRAEKPEVDGGVSRWNDSDNTQLLVTRSHITVYPGESVNIGVVAASNKMETFWVPNNPYGVSGLAPIGVYLETAGTETYKKRENGYGGTVAWDQPAGDTVVTFAVRSKNNALVTRDLRVTVLELTKKLDAVPGEKVEVADLNNVSENEKNKIIAATEKANSNFPPGTLYNVDQRGNLVITYPDKSTDKITAAYLVTPAAREADKYTPTAKAQTVAPGSTPDAKNSINNAGELPSGTTFAYKIPVDTATEGEKDAIVVVTYPDGSKDEVPVKVTVKDPRSDADKNEPKAKEQTVKVGDAPKAEDSIANFKDLPSGTTAKFKEPVDTTTPGDKTPVVVVTYPDGSKDEVPVKVTVKDSSALTQQEITADPGTAKASKDGKISDESAPKLATKDPAITPVVNPSTKKAGAKELPNTGTEKSNASLGLVLLAAVTGGLLFAKKRKEEE
ncbi:Rib/alpha-like domain-containing protein [Streptococcus sp. k-90]|uniref:Rib/alpha-like domain-containing protein n=1 Tax=Streptococcus sp. k-90 TaxID=2582630 RepID=UPI0015648F3C|nr:Rib/alpha-like domain-containing protein [Streptococcus sp. k-90]